VHFQNVRVLDVSTALLLLFGEEFCSFCVIIESSAGGRQLCRVCGPKVEAGESKGVLCCFGPRLRIEVRWELYCGG
jgi:hypothetical protein